MAGELAVVVVVVVVVVVIAAAAVAVSEAAENVLAVSFFACSRVQALQ